MKITTQAWETYIRRLAKLNEKAAQLIRTGLVQCDYEQIDSVSYQVKPGSVFSVRGHGKFVLSQEIRPTKKGRMFVTIQKYI